MGKKYLTSIYGIDLVHNIHDVSKVVWKFPQKLAGEHVEVQ
jgi:hypothetical protein